MGALGRHPCGMGGGCMESVGGWFPFAPRFHCMCGERGRAGCGGERGRGYCGGVGRWQAKGGIGLGASGAAGGGA